MPSVVGRELGGSEDTVVCNSKYCLHVVIRINPSCPEECERACCFSVMEEMSSRQDTIQPVYYYYLRIQQPVRA